MSDPLPWMDYSGMEEHPHDNCGSFECRTCGNKVLLSYSCKACFEEADYEETMDITPDDELCLACHEKRRKADMEEARGDWLRDRAKDDRATRGMSESMGDQL